MAEAWTIEHATTLDLGDSSAPITEVEVLLVAGRVAVVAAASDDGSAQVEVSEISGGPLTATLDAGKLRISHPKAAKEGWLEKLRKPWTDLSAVVSITAPRAAKVTLSTVSAETLVAGMAAPVKLKTVSAELAVDQVTGNVEAKSVSGALEVRELRGDLVANTVSGDVTVHARALPHLTAKTVSGDVTVDLADADAGSATTSEQDAKTVSGSVTVRIPAGTGYLVTSKSVSGDLVAGTERVGKQPGQSKGTLRHGNEAVKLTAGTLSGDVTVLHATDQAAPSSEPAA
ncbi:MAG: DUF4097 family beta strand repeat-containing protein [Jatrophihabitans sp.]